MSNSILGDRTVTEEESARAVAAARAEGQAEGDRRGQEVGAAAERARIRTIVQDPRMAGRESAALDLAIDAPTMSADAVARFLESRVPAVAAQGAPVAQRVEETGVNAISPGQQAPAAGAPGGGSVVGPGREWKEFIPANRLKKR